MKISIVTATYNCASSVADCLASVAGQVYADVEHVVIDGASTDGTLEVLQAHRDSLAVLVSEPDSGIYGALNKGIALATGEVVGVLHADDIFCSTDTLIAVASVFEREPSIDIVFGDVVYTGLANPNKILRFYSGVRFASWKLRFGFMPPHTATFFRKSIFDRHGSYRSDYMSAGDFEFFVRTIFKCKVKYFYLKKTIVNMRVGGMSTSGWKSHKRTSIEFLRALRENGVYSNLFFIILRLPIKYFEKLYFRSATLLRKGLR